MYIKHSGKGIDQKKIFSRGGGEEWNFTWMQIDIDSYFMQHTCECVWSTYTEKSVFIIIVHK